VTQAERDKLFADAVQAALRKMRSAKPTRNKEERNKKEKINDEQDDNLSGAARGHERGLTHTAMENDSSLRPMIC
jgi:hypothetical protein